MSETTTTPEATEEVKGLGHPVRSFVVVLLLIGAALLGVRWSGGVNPQVTVSAGSYGDAENGRQYRMVLVQNNGLAPLRVEAVDWSTREWSDIRVGVLPADITYEGQHPLPRALGDGSAEPFTIGAGFDEGRWIIVSGRPACPEPLDSEALGLELHIRTWVGVERTAELAVTRDGSMAQGEDEQSRPQHCGAGA